MIQKLALLAFACIAFSGEARAQDSDYVRERALMVKTIQAYALTDIGFSGKKGISASVLEAMRQTKRHLFIPKRFRSLAYADRPVPIGHEQTISQPYIVAVMTDLAGVAKNHTVLEIGTGSGYQAAILARLARKVCTIEIVRPLGETATKLLEELGYHNVSVRIGDGYKGWPECGPFDAVIVTAALGHVPPPLIEQLKVGGRLVMPVGSAGATQKLTVVEKIAPGKTKTRDVGLVRFVPFTRSPN
jgi:protein-L-isoaspartate(D-aspartate) O-methyltransferase